MQTKNSYVETQKLLLTLHWESQQTDKYHNRWSKGKRGEYSNQTCIDKKYFSVNLGWGMETVRISKLSHMTVLMITGTKIPVIMSTTHIEIQILFILRAIKRRLRLLSKPAARCGRPARDFLWTLLRWCHRSNRWIWGQRTSFCNPPRRWMKDRSAQPD